MFNVSEDPINMRIEDKCGEIFRSNNVFLIVCTECQEKNFNFQEFLAHFQLKHTEECDLKDNILEPDEKEGEWNSWHKPEIIFNDIEKVPESNSKFNENTHLDPNVKPFESITLQQDDLAVHINKVDDEDTLHTNTQDASVDSNEINEKPAKKKKSKFRLPKTHCCKECDKRFISDAQLKQHLQKHHIIEKEFKCDQCEEAFRDDRSLRKHIRVIHKGFKCKNCERIYKNFHSLQEHIHTHHETSNFVCDTENCGKSFQSLLKLRRHQKIHENVFQHVCEICGYRARVKHVMVVHLRTHSGERPYPCKICGKHFISQSMVREHQATHAVQRNHACEVCGATFSAPKALYHHKHLHLGIKKFVCPFCDKAYSQAAGLSAHMRQHKVDGKIM